MKDLLHILFVYCTRLILCNIQIQLHTRKVGDIFLHGLQKYVHKPTEENVRLSFLALNWDSGGKKSCILQPVKWNSQKVTLSLTDLKNLIRRSNITVPVVYRYLNRKLLVQPTLRLKGVRTDLVISHNWFVCFVKLESLSEIETLLVLFYMFILKIILPSIQSSSVSWHWIWLWVNFAMWMICLVFYYLSWVQQ